MVELIQIDSEGSEESLGTFALDAVGAEMLRRAGDRDAYENPYWYRIR